MLAAAAAAWTAADDRDTYREDLGALIDALHRATLLTDPAQRAHAWADIDEQITRLAPAIPYLWARQANIRSENVVGTIDADNAVWSLAHTRLR